MNKFFFIALVIACLVSGVASDDNAGVETTHASKWCDTQRRNSSVDEKEITHRLAGSFSFRKTNLKDYGKKRLNEKNIDLCRLVES